MQAVQIWHKDDPKLEFVLSLGDIVDGRDTQVGFSLLCGQNAVLGY